MRDEQLVSVDDETYELLEMLAVNRKLTVAQMVIELVEAEYERMEPGSLYDLRRPGAAIKRLYAAAGRPVPAAFLGGRPQSWLG